MAAASRGPQVTQLDATLSELRRLLELHITVDDVDRRWSSARIEASMAAVQAHGNSTRLSVASWYRPRLRDEMLIFSYWGSGRGSWAQDSDG